MSPVPFVWAPQKARPDLNLVPSQAAKHKPCCSIFCAVHLAGKRGEADRGKSLDSMASNETNIVKVKKSVSEAIFAEKQSRLILRASHVLWFSLPSSIYDKKQAVLTSKCSPELVPNVR